MWAATSKVIWVELPKLSGTHISQYAPDAEYGATGRLNVFSAGFQSYFGPVLFEPLIPPFWNGNICPVPLYLGIM